MIKHFRRWFTPVPVKTENRKTGYLVLLMTGLNHIILFFRKKTVLRAEKTGQLTGKSLIDEITAMDKRRIRRGLVAEKPEPSAHKEAGRIGDQLFDAGFNFRSVHQKRKSAYQVKVHGGSKLFSVSP